MNWQRVTLSTQQENPQIGGIRPLYRTRNAYRFNRIIRFSQTRRIENRNRKSPQVHTNLDDITGRASVLGCDRSLAAGKPVQQCRLPGIGGTENGNLETVPNAFRYSIAILLRPQIIQYIANKRQDFWPYIGRNFFVCKIQDGFGQRGCAQQFLPPDLGSLAQLAGKYPHRLAPLHLCLGLYQIRETFDLRQIQTTILQRPARELSSFGKSKSRQTTKQRQHCLHYGLTTVQVKLNNRLSGEAPILLKADHQSVIQDRVTVLQGT
ncbi:hypothetical protein GCM10011345_27740 [Gemmobacter megaterium]|nr:hypothetical protein GCM10011345_27740 [Gemmobacter megaterium]